MVLASWIALLLGGVSAGLCPVGAMALPKRQERLAIAGALVAAAAAAAGLVGIAVMVPRTGTALVAGFLGVAAALGGFALGGALLAQIGAEPALASLEPSTQPLEGALVVVLSSAEPGSYEPVAVAAELRDLDEAGVHLPPEPMRAFIFASEKARYAAICGSPARETCEAVASRLAGMLGHEVAEVRTAWCHSGPLLDEVVADAAARGRRDFVVVPLAVAEDAPMAHARHRLEILRPANAGMGVAFAQPLWSSQALAEHLASRIAESASQRASTGVALIGCGQPRELDGGPQRLEHETFFSQRVRALLVEAGFEDTHVRTGWAEWQEPGVTEVVRHLAALGCPQILVVPASMPAETRMTLIDLPDAVAQARVESTSSVTILPAWGDDPVVAEALACVVREGLRELEG